ncbi:sortase [Micromonospora sp. NPDC049559]|uniref:sortase domain-containing protein n=1 Tax=Micromonospora sp. NPDC049559 TaxID=3155923 RepID=UPI0034486328
MSTVTVDRPGAEPAPVPPGPSEPGPEPAARAPEPAPRRTRPAHPPAPPGVRLAVRAMATLAALMLGFVAYLVLVTPMQAQREQEVLRDRMRADLANAVAPVGGAIPAGTPVAVLQIPGLKLDHVVVEGTASGDLFGGLGHKRDTVLPGQPGVSHVYGRRGTFGGPFAHVDRLVEGDEIRAVTGQGTFVYRVDRIRRDGDPAAPPLPAGGGRLILVTAEDTGLLRAERTVYVDATLLDPPQPVPSGRLQFIPPYEKPLRGDPGAWFPLVLWLQALAIFSAAATWARAYWGRWETWLVGTPVFVALAWQLYENAARLLPNLT